MSDVAERPNAPTISREPDDHQLSQHDGVDVCRGCVNSLGYPIAWDIAHPSTSAGAWARTLSEQYANIARNETRGLARVLNEAEARKYRRIAFDMDAAFPERAIATQTEWPEATDE